MIDEFYYDGSVAPITDDIPLTGEHGIAQSSFKCSTGVQQISMVAAVQHTVKREIMREGTIRALQMVADCA